MKIRQFLLSAFLISIVACSADSPEKRLKAINGKELELEKSGGTAPGTESSTSSSDILNLYLAFVESYPQHEQAPEMLYKAAMLQADRKQEFDNCIATLERLRREYPQHRRAENALFLIGYTYSEQLKNFEQAKTYYNTFLQQYPNSELKTAVEFELANLGKPVEELDIIKNLSSDPTN